MEQTLVKHYRKRLKTFKESMKDVIELYNESVDEKVKQEGSKEIYYIQGRIDQIYELLQVLEG
jgi:DNA segregation ATPase FtsK/SpoIIIE-like protein